MTFISLFYKMFTRLKKKMYTQIIKMEILLMSDNALTSLEDKNHYNSVIYFQ